MNLKSNVQYFSFSKIGFGNCLFELFVRKARVSISCFLILFSILLCLLSDVAEFDFFFYQFDNQNKTYYSNN